MVQIVSDTVPNFAKENVDKYGLHLIPTYVTIGLETYRDYIDLSSDTFYKRLVTLEANDMPSTSQPSVSDFKALYEKIAKTHPKESIISLHTSSKLSGTVESARRAAAKLPDLDIRIMDTYSVGVGQGLMVIDAARLAKEKKSADEIVKHIDKVRKAHKMFMLADTLEYLQRSGRIGRAARFLGTLLNMKPVLTLKEGAVEAHDRQISRERARSSIKQACIDAMKGQKGVRLGVMHSQVEKDAKALGAELEKAIQPEFMVITEIGPSMGVHIGPGALGIAWYKV